MDSASAGFGSGQRPFIPVKAHPAVVDMELAV